ncbi:MAG: GNAT family N-acetyltransferase [Archaeoglobus sp.]|nr:GNAT family N-acetyltransferase [Archaeoglobus sp.]
MEEDSDHEDCNRDGDHETDNSDIGILQPLQSNLHKSKTLEKDFLSKINLRNVCHNDIGDFVRVYRRSYEGLEEYAYTKNRQIKSYFKWMFSRDRDGFFVAEIKETEIKETESGDSKISNSKISNPPAKAIGYIMVDTNWFSPFEMRRVGEIHELVVLPEFRKRGIGSVLVSKAFEYMKLRGRKIAELWVGHKNYSAQKFYKKLGFEEKDPFGKWIRMTKKLTV